MVSACCALIWLSTCCEALSSSPVQGDRDVTWQTVRKIDDLYFQLVATWPKVFVPQLINFLRRAGKCFFPARLLLIDGAALVRTQLVGKAKDLDLDCLIFHRSFDDRYPLPNCLLLGDARRLAELIDKRLLLGLGGGELSRLLFGLFRLSEGNSLPDLLGGRQFIENGCHALLHASADEGDLKRTIALMCYAKPVRTAQML